MIPTEPIGSIPRSDELVAALAAEAAGSISGEELDALLAEAVRETIAEFEATGSPVVTDGEQRKPSFATYPLHGLDSLSPEGVVIPFADGHTRQLPVLTKGPFQYATHAASYLRSAQEVASRPVKQAVISASALSLLYPAGGLDGYSQQEFLDDLVDEAEADIRGCLEAGAHSVQIDFTEGRLAIKIDPSGHLLNSFIDLNNLALSRFSKEERKRIGIHTCPGSDRDSTHSADVDYTVLLPSLFELNAGNFYIALAAEKEPVRVLKTIRKCMKPDRRIFIGVVAPINPRVDTPEEVRDRVLEAAKYIPLEQLGTTDDCGFSPFSDDTSTPREVAFANIRARVLGTQMAAEILGRN